MTHPTLPTMRFASPASRTSVFLAFSLLSFISIGFSEQAFNFAAFDMTHSKTVVSIIRPLSSVAYIMLYMFVGVIVDLYSRKFFVYFRLILIAVFSLVFFFLYKIDKENIMIFFIFVFMNAVTWSLFQASTNSIFYDLCGTDKLSKWISRRAMVRNGASIAGFLILSFAVSDGALMFAIYALILLAALPIFWIIGYEDQNRKPSFSSFREGLAFVIDQLKDFIKTCRANTTLLALFAFSFIKTMFIFWPMAIGALLKFGIETAGARRTYLIAMVIMDIVSIVSSYVLGKAKESFTTRSFVVGAAISGLGVFLLSLARGAPSSIAMLAIMYVGLAVSAISSSYILRIELPEKHRTQGLGFSVVPYYTADMISGLIFALLLQFFSVDQMLFWDGLLLMLICAVGIFFFKKIKIIKIK